MRRRLALVAVIAAAVAICLAVSRKGSAAQQTDANVVACRVLEAHTSASPAATAVVFHQQAKEDQARLGALLREHDVAKVEWQAGGGNWEAATAFRLKSCFGRGLLLLPAGGATLKDGDRFLIKFPAGK